MEMMKMTIFPQFMKLKLNNIERQEKNLKKKK
jgi:hypothetical protein